MKFFKIAFLLLIAPSFAAEVTPPDQEISVDTLKPTVDHQSPLIHGCVNVITGHFVDQEMDIELAGPRSMVLSRSYSSGCEEHMTLETGWNFDSLPWCDLYRVGDGKLFHAFAPKNQIVYHMQGGGSAITEREAVKTGIEKYTLSHGKKSYLGWCHTDIYSGAKSHRKNFSYSILDTSNKTKKVITIKDGSGKTCSFRTNRRFKYEKEDSRTSNEKIEVPIQRIDFPNDHYDLFETSKKKEAPYYSSMSFYGADSECFGSFDFTREGDLTVKASNGRRMVYQFTKLDKKKHYLSEVEAFGPSEVLPYYSCSYHYDSENKICGKFEPQDRFLRVKYYKTKDKRKGRVEYLYGPKGHLFKFDYDIKSDDNKMHLEGTTCVKDALGRESTYKYEKNRLNKITTFLKKHPYCTTFLTWTDDESDTPGLLTKKQVVNQKKRKVVSTQHYQYDLKGNLLEEVLEGNLTGENESRTSKFYSYIDNGKAENLLHKVTGDGKEITIHYLSDTDLVEAVYVKGGPFQKRQFYFYDNNHLLVKQIQDDGVGFGAENTSGVTYRKIIETTLENGLPIETVEKYWNPERSQEDLFQRNEFQYNYDGKPLNKKVYHFDKGWVFDQEWQWKYDSAGRCIEEVDPDGTIKTYSYDLLGNKTEDISEDLHQEHVYDELNRLTKTTYNKDISESWEYDLVGNKTSYTDKYQQTSKYEYDDLNRLISAQDPQGGTEKYTYDVLGNKTSVKDKNGHTTHYTYNIRGSVTSIIYPDGSTEKRRYTEKGLLEEEMYADGLTIRYKYDAFDREEEKEWLYQGKSLKKETNSYNTFFLLSKTEGDRTTTFHYNHKGQLVEEREGEKLTTYSYDRFGNKSCTRIYATDTTFLEKHQKFDQLGRVVYSYEADETGKINHEKHQTYNAQGKLAKVVEGDAVTYYAYDAFGNLTSTIDPNLNEATISEDYSSHTVTTIYANGVQLIQYLDSIGRVKEQKQFDPFGKLLQKEAYSYDANGNKLEEVFTVLFDGKKIRQIINKFAYDSRNRLISQKEAFGTGEEKRTHFTYDEMGRKIAHSKPGTILSFAYDPLGRLVKKWSHNLSYTYVYDKMGRLTVLKNELTGKATERFYDSYGNIIKEKLKSGLVLHRAFDLLNRPTVITLPDGSKIHYQYEGSKLKTIRREGFKEYSHQYHYDDQGHIVLEDLPMNGGTLSHLYEATSRWMSSEHTHLSQEALGYDAVYNLQGIRRKGSVIDEEVHYEYDYLNQLIEETGSRPHTYQNDSLNNRLQKDEDPYKLNSLNQLTSQSDTKYSYDSNGNLVSIASKDKTLTLFYDALDRLVEVEEGGTHTYYDYDGLNRRLSKTTSEKEEQYLYDGKREMGSFEKGVPQTLRILGNGVGSSDIHATLAIEKGSKVYLPLHHPFGHLSMLLDAETGAPVQHMRATAFGECQLYQNDGAELSLASSLSPWLISSKRYDPETGFTLYGLRYYSPEIGRWITPDPAGFADGPNLYAYARNNPLIYVDLYGLSIFSAIWKGTQSALPYVGAKALIYGVTIFSPPIGAALNVGLTCYNIYSAADLAVQTGSYVANSLNNASTIAEGVSRIGSDITQVASNISFEGATSMATSMLISKKVGTLGNKTSSIASTVSAADKTKQAANSVLLNNGPIGKNAAIVPFDKPKFILSTRELLRRSSEQGPFHNFPESLNTSILNEGSKTVLPNFFKVAKKGLSHTSIMYKSPGAINGIDGIFEIATRPSMTGHVELIMHRFFRPN